VGCTRTRFEQRLSMYRFAPAGQGVLAFVQFDRNVLSVIHMSSGVGALHFANTLTVVVIV
jgi:hypothetical protein